MGYFSNGTEGDMYEARYCRRCIHSTDPDKGCAVFDAHLLFNYEQHGNEKLKSVLEILIPREGVFNGECKMFVPKEQAHA